MWKLFSVVLFVAIMSYAEATSCRKCNTIEDNLNFETCKSNISKTNETCEPSAKCFTATGTINGKA